MTQDMREVIKPKVDQLTADDALGGPITIRITGVKITPGTEQPISVSFEGDNGKPWRPCKTTARLMVAAWGADAKEYTGRSLTLYRDETVKWGGLAVGGLRISHMSHIDSDLVLALTMTKGKKAPTRVKPLKAETVPLKVVKPEPISLNPPPLEPMPDAFDIAEFEGIVDLAITNMGAEFPTWWDEQYDVRKQAAGVDATKARAIAKKANDYIETLKGEI